MFLCFVFFFLMLAGEFLSEMSSFVFVISKSSDMMSRSAEQPSHFRGCRTVCSPVVIEGDCPQTGLNKHF